MAAIEVGKMTKKSISTPKKSGEVAHEVEFTFSAPNAKKVCIAGKFNEWNTSATPMKKSKDGTWKVKVKLSPGKYEYKYFVDGDWASDRSCSELVSNPFGTTNCVISVH
jgi:1,4-alpha-glucan branching enzyme